MSTIKGRSCFFIVVEIGGIECTTNYNTWVITGILFLLNKELHVYRLRDLFYYFPSWSRRRKLKKVQILCFCSIVVSRPGPREAGNKRGGTPCRASNWSFRMSPPATTYPAGVQLRRFRCQVSGAKCQKPTKKWSFPIRLNLDIWPPNRLNLSTNKGHNLKNC